MIFINTHLPCKDDVIVVLIFLWDGFHFWNRASSCIIYGKDMKQEERHEYERRAAADPGGLQ